jgi:hypothetical protein
VGECASFGVEHEQLGQVIHVVATPPQGESALDVKALLALFDDEFFAEGIVAFDEDNAEPIVRACAAVRLRLREVYLKGLDDDALEGGEVELEQMSEAVRKAFMCYLFLATVQELIIQHLDSSIIES